MSIWKRVWIPILLIVIMALMIAMIVILNDSSISDEDNPLLFFEIPLIAITTAVYAIIVVRRINPKKYIYISYASVDTAIAHKTEAALEQEFKSLSKYRFEFLSADSVPYGENMYDMMEENILKADIVIVVVSRAYIESQWCMEEFSACSDWNKFIIPIVTSSYDDLRLLPKDLSDIKALSLADCESEKDFSHRIGKLAKDLIRRRRD